MAARRPGPGAGRRCVDGEVAEQQEEQHGGGGEPGVPHPADPTWPTPDRTGGEGERGSTVPTRPRASTSEPWGGGGAGCWPRRRNRRGRRSRDAGGCRGVGRGRLTASFGLAMKARTRAPPCRRGRRRRGPGGRRRGGGGMGLVTSPPEGPEGEGPEPGVGEGEHGEQVEPRPPVGGRPSSALHRPGGGDEHRCEHWEQQERRRVSRTAVRRRARRTGTGRRPCLRPGRSR